MTTWRGTATLRPGRLTYTGLIGAAHRHRHAAVQVVQGLGGPLTVRDESGAGVRVRAAIIPSGAVHEIAGSSDGVLTWVDAESTLGRALTRRVRDTGLPHTSAEAWAAALAKGADGPAEAWTALERVDSPADTRAAAERVDDSVEARAAVSDPTATWAAAKRMDDSVEARAAVGDPVDTWAAVMSVGDPGEVGPVSPVLRDALAVVPALLDGPVRLDDVAAAVGISGSRLGHLFSERIGLPFRAYVRWARLRRAIEHARLGGTITEAAHAAGFADGAHLTRVCREMFGLAPSHLVAGVTISAGPFKP
ncbi:helix-turn-helix transcriptional regulator [Actinokineospora sp. UTMC 2448]|uniref:helix-turn-helix transcriptional regulator n=1 Tax=Actinokineospora sp. UTMC 2448 TaxID=2268449 RepID=UPI002164DDA6|nr:helix-turn-helix transcriptional regulator [Actinokineospora sp. UTMC 2448]UVS80414.1 DNA-binding transcriptional regulator AraC [Actinokineospora sp. UTMC 2448]